MTKKIEIKKEKAMAVLEQALHIYQQFLDVVQKKIIEPLTEGDIKDCNENVSQLDKKASISDVIKLVVRGATLLVPLMLKFAPENSEMQYLNEKEIAERTEYYKDRIDKILAKGI